MSHTNSHSSGFHPQSGLMAARRLRSNRSDPHPRSHRMPRRLNGRVESLLAYMGRVVAHKLFHLTYPTSSPTFTFHPSISCALTHCLNCKHSQPTSSDTCKYSNDWKNVGRSPTDFSTWTKTDAKRVYGTIKSNCLDLTKPELAKDNADDYAIFALCIKCPA